MESPVDRLQVSHPACAGGFPSLGLLAPVILSGLSSRVTARAAGALLDVKGASAATPAERVRLIMTLAKAGGTLRHLELGRLGIR